MLASLTMSSIEPEDFNCLLLEPFQLCNQKIRVLEYAGGGNAGYVFKVLVGDNTYALKMVSRMWSHILGPLLIFRLVQIRQPSAAPF
jgi:hypothetical protein